MGLTREDDVLPKTRPAESWQGLLTGWRRELDSLGREFAQGVARVDPKRGLATCRHCDLHPLCRVHERIAALDDEDEGDAQ